MNDAPLTIVTAVNCTSANYRPAAHVAFVFLPDSSAFVLDMAADVYALDRIAADLLAKLFAGDHAPAQTRRKFLDKLIALNLLQRSGEDRAPPRASPLSGALASLATSMLRRPGTIAVRFALVLARFGLKRDGWATTLTAWTARLQPRAQLLSPEAIDALMSDASALDVSGADCKERALCAWALARQSGLPAEITIGVALHPLSGHSWCSSGGRILGDTPGRIARYAPALSYA